MPNNVAGRTFFWGSVTIGGTKYIEEPYSSWMDFDGESAAVAGGVSIGKLTYYNGSSEAGTGAEFVDLTLRVNFANPSSQDDFTFRLEIRNIYNIDETTDPDAGWASADIVRFAIRSIEVSPGLYLNLSFLPEVDPGAAGDGVEFNAGEGYNAFRVLEGEQWTAQIVASLGSYLPPVTTPDGGTSLALLGLAFVSLGALRRKGNLCEPV